MGQNVHLTGNDKVSSIATCHVSISMVQLLPRTEGLVLIVVEVNNHVVSRQSSKKKKEIKRRYGMLLKGCKTEEADPLIQQGCMELSKIDLVEQRLDDDDDN